MNELEILGWRILGNTIKFSLSNTYKNLIVISGNRITKKGNPYSWQANI